MESRKNKIKKNSNITNLHLKGLREFRITLEHTYKMTIKATTKAVIKYLEAIKKKHREEILFACGYEAGPTGYGLCRGLQKAGFGCAVMAPTTMSNPE